MESTEDVVAEQSCLDQLDKDQECPPLSKPTGSHDPSSSERSKAPTDSQVKLYLRILVLCMA